jgi:hypothetical protein
MKKSSSSATARVTIGTLFLLTAVILAVFALSTTGLG